MSLMHCFILGFFKTWFICSWRGDYLLILIGLFIFRVNFWNFSIFLSEGYLCLLNNAFCFKFFAKTSPTLAFAKSIYYYTKKLASKRFPMLIVSGSKFRFKEKDFFGVSKTSDPFLIRFDLIFMAMEFIILMSYAILSKS